MSALFEAFESRNLIRRDRVNADLLARLPFARLLDVIDTAASSTARSKWHEEAGATSHCASMTMGGGEGGCSVVACRIQRMEELCRFAALYSDRVFFHNFLANVAPSFGHPPEEDDLQFRLNLGHDLEVLLRARPLIEEGLLVPFTTPRTYCPSCFAVRSVGLKARRGVARAQLILRRELLREMRVELEGDEYGYMAVVSEPKKLFDHGSLSMDIDLPPAIRTNSRIVKRLHNGQRILASAALRRTLDLHTLFTRDVLNSTTYQMAVSAMTGASLLTGRLIDIEILTLISSDPEIERRNALLAKHFTAMVPFASDVPTSRLVRLRKREHNAFVRYRAAMNEALREVSNEGQSLTRTSAAAIYGDVLAPELARLEQNMKKAKRDLVTTPLFSAVGVAAALTLGIYSGLVPAEFVEVTKALGLTKVVYDTVTKTAALVDGRQSIRQEKFYFLWRVQHEARRRRSTHPGV